MGMFSTDDGTYDIDEEFIHTYLDDIIKDRSQVVFELFKRTFSLDFYLAKFLKSSKFPSDSCHRRQMQSSWSRWKHLWLFLQRLLLLL